MAAAVAALGPLAAGCGGVSECPLCFAAYLTAAGCGAALARAVAPIVVGGARVVVAMAVVIALAVRVLTAVWRRMSLGRV